MNTKDFFIEYVLAPYDAWCQDELCLWKAFATVSGINALVEHAFRETNPAESIGTQLYGRKLEPYRDAMPFASEHRLIKHVVEVYKHVELRATKEQKVPGRIEEMETQIAGAFPMEFSREFAVARPQIGFPYQADAASFPQWVPLREIVEKCINHWRGHLGLAA